MVAQRARTRRRRIAAIVLAEVLDEERHAGEGTGEPRGVGHLFVGAGVGAHDDGVQGGIDGVGPLSREGEQFGRRDLAAGDEIGEGGGVEGEVLAEVHASQPRAWVTEADAIP